jgi:hypothetical protein
MAILPEHQADSSLDAVFHALDVLVPNGLLSEFSRTMAGRAEGHGEIAARFPSEWPSTFRHTFYTSAEMRHREARNHVARVG